MIALLIRWALASLALLLTVHLYAGQGFGFTEQAWWIPVKVTLLLGLVNALVRPLVFLVKLVTLPMTLLTLGLWSLLISLLFNVLALFLVSYFHWGLQIGGDHPVITAFLAAITLSILNMVLSMVFASGRWLTRRALT